MFDAAHRPVVVAAAPHEKDARDDDLRQATAMAPDEVSRPAKQWRTSARRSVVQRHAVRMQRKVRKVPERKLGAEEREFFSGW